MYRPLCMSSGALQHIGGLSALVGQLEVHGQPVHAASVWAHGMELPVHGQPGHAAARSRKQALQQHRCLSASSRVAYFRRGTMTLNA